MRNIDRGITQAPYRLDYPLDVRRLRQAAPELRGKTDLLIDNLYSTFSDEEYCAGWMNLNERRIVEFRKWLQAAAPVLPGIPQ